jgi:putative transposase
MPSQRKGAVTTEPGKGLNLDLDLDLDLELIKQLAPGTPHRATINQQLAALKKAIFERALGGELTHHLGYAKHGRQIRAAKSDGSQMMASPAATASA